MKIIDGLGQKPLLRTLEEKPNEASAELLKRISPLAWQHINFYDRYRFDSDLKPIDLAALATQLSGPDTTRWQTSA